MSPEMFSEVKGFVGFGAADEGRLKELVPIIEKHGADVTRRFYDVLLANPTTAPIVDGRVDLLKGTHAQWMKNVVNGPWDDNWFQAQIRIGHVHVKQGVPPLHVELTFSLLREFVAEAIRTERGGDAVEHVSSFVKILDMALAMVNLAYAEERLDRLSAFTGFSRKLIENCINKKPKA